MSLLVTLYSRRFLTPELSVSRGPQAGMEDCLQEESGSWCLAPHGGFRLEVGYSTQFLSRMAVTLWAGRYICHIL